MIAGQVVDTPTAAEFLGRVLELTTRQELAQIGAEVAEKSAAMRGTVGADAARMDAAAVRELLSWVFCARRHVEALFAVLDPTDFAHGLAELLDGSGGLAGRFDAFGELLAGCPEMAVDLPGELLHHLDPGRYWLWTRWMWDPTTETGALRLVTMDEVDLAGASPGETYLMVGQALAFVAETGHAAGFTTFDHRGRGEPEFGIDVFLAAVYGVYLHTVLRMRMTAEFTKLLPPLPQLTRRLLGVHRPVRRKA
jgi:hypothetical protein